VSSGQMSKRITLMLLNRYRSEACREDMRIQTKRIPQITRKPNVKIYAIGDAKYPFSSFAVRLRVFLIRLQPPLQ
jgi:hypothetical protein